MPRTAFFAYPAEPPFVAAGIQEAVSNINNASAIKVQPWPLMKPQGLKVDGLIRDRITDVELLIADITYPNFNVYYEIGYAIASGRSCLPTVNSAVEPSISNVNLTGIFDTIGQIRYSNSTELAKEISESLTQKGG